MNKMEEDKKSGEDIRHNLKKQEQVLSNKLIAITHDQIKNLDLKETERILAFLENRKKELQGDLGGDPDGTTMGSGEMGETELTTPNEEEEEKKKKLAQATGGDVRTSQEKQVDFQERKRAMNKSEGREQLLTRQEDSGQTVMRHEQEALDRKRLQQSFGQEKAQSLQLGFERADKFGSASALERAFKKSLRNY